jgi:hypothetical protein
MDSVNIKHQTIGRLLAIKEMAFSNKPHMNKQITTIDVIYFETQMTSPIYIHLIYTIRTSGVFPCLLAVV